MNSIKISNLYNEFDYELSLDNELTILTAPNGYGKTTIFNILEAISKKNIFYFFEIEFSKIEIQIDGSNLIISKNPGNTINFSALKIDLENYYEKKQFREDSFRDNSYSDRDLNNFSFLHDEIDSLRAALDNIVLTFTFKRQTSLNENFSFKTIDYLFGHQIINSMLDLRRFLGGVDFRNRELRNSDVHDIRLWSKSNNEFRQNLEDVSNLLDKIGLNVLFIPANRIIQKEVEFFDKIPSRYRIRNYQNNFAFSRKLAKIISNEIKQKIEEVSSLIKKDFSELHLSFPNKLIKLYNSPNKAMDNSSYDTEINRLRKELDHLSDIFRKFLLIDTDVTSISDFTAKSKDQKTFILNYIQSTLSIFKKYEGFSQKLEKIETIFNERNDYSDKTLLITNEGYQILKEGRLLHISQLSSGEINDLILWHEIIFVAKANSLILIDEPEISLHLLWQQEFIDKLTTIHQLNDLKDIHFLVATHSPDIIAGYGENVINLEDLANATRNKKNQSRI